MDASAIFNKAYNAEIAKDWDTCESLYEQVINECPNTSSANEAKIRLERLEKNKEYLAWKDVNNSNTVIYITNTESIQGKNIIEYLGVIRSNCKSKCLNADIFTTLSEQKNILQDTFDDLSDQTMRNLIRQANTKGANAIIGVKIDYINTFGNNYILMAYGIATAVRVE